MTDQQRAADAARTNRVEMYAAWLADDVDGLLHNVKPSALSTAILAEARAAVALALNRIDIAIQHDRAAHAKEAA
ncbi:hypothetical protein [Bradyrhizobium ivorense]|uniref:hypothetical protein n=1 Tax=Bradyrhizobium ivorense TaxID=2511166 RepID=UPI0010BC2263|nr:hypothetical protein [Bradyrhizobium ivorense]VIO73851.1 hypothetical protein CI41S_39600 [Bradyrhizobium ivorense]